MYCVYDVTDVAVSNKWIRVDTNFRDMKFPFQFAKLCCKYTRHFLLLS
jgi:hypothetical protein